MEHELQCAENNIDARISELSEYLKAVKRYRKGETPDWMSVSWRPTQSMADLESSIAVHMTLTAMKEDTITTEGSGGE